MDIELVCAFAPLERVVVYFSTGTSHGDYHAFSRAVVDEENQPSVISCSWGTSEANVTEDYVEIINDVFRSAALRGITICVSSGDDGAGLTPGSKPTVNFPASSPYVLGCGGTNLSVKTDEETVWNERVGSTALASTGGASSLFNPAPEWQKIARIHEKTKKTGRGVPDVAAKADMAGSLVRASAAKEAPDAFQQASSLRHSDDRSKPIRAQGLNCRHGRPNGETLSSSLSHCRGGKQAAKKGRDRTHPNASIHVEPCIWILLLTIAVQ
jgi:subtilase family serine protease